MSIADKKAIVVGGGVIGLSIARELASKDWGVILLDKGEPGREASSAAAGMLAPGLEFEIGSPLFQLGTASRDAYGQYAAELKDETGIDVDLRLDGILNPVHSDDTPPPAGATRVTGDQLHELEPSLAAYINAANFHEGEGSVDNRALVSALLAAARLRGVTIAKNTRVEEILLAGDAVCGIRTADVEIGADVVVNCAGAWAGQINVPDVETNVRPVKGQMLLLARPRSATPPAGPRFTIYSHLSYVVPRSDGRIIVGTTVEDCGFDKRVEAGAVNRLLTGATRLCPALDGAEFVESWAGLRPRGEDTVPKLGPVGPRGYYQAIGHFRNGILLTPLTARVVVESVERNHRHYQGAGPELSSVPQ